jgi:hypothetical protein
LLWPCGHAFASGGSFEAPTLSALCVGGARTFAIVRFSNGLSIVARLDRPEKEEIGKNRKFHRRRRALSRRVRPLCPIADPRPFPENYLLSAIMSDDAMR